MYKEVPSEIFDKDEYMVMYTDKEVVSVKEQLMTINLSGIEGEYRVAFLSIIKCSLFLTVVTMLVFLLQRTSRRNLLSKLTSQSLKSTITVITLFINCRTSLIMTIFCIALILKSSLLNRTGLL